MSQNWPELSALDRPEILQFVFYPRRDFCARQSAANVIAGSIPVEETVSISYCLYFGDRKYPNILFFHGNGEIASDYEDIGHIYNQIGVNLFVADYRGYGWSDGEPTLAAMIKDAHHIFDGFKRVLKDMGLSGGLFLMGRSLGSASVIELAYHYQAQLKGLILESGFVNVFNLLDYLGFPFQAMGIALPETPAGLERVHNIYIPTLVIHGEYDQIVPVSEGKALYENIGAKDKRLLIIPGVDHNTILLGGMQKYFEELRSFVLAHS
ncbi:MAG TPA: alpha/beta hydrolase [Dehalococcoidia bacterium]|nr:alpha/beta hydrolase [Dehalococcoidia bacterium]